MSKKIWLLFLFLVLAVGAALSGALGLVFWKHTVGRWFLLTWSVLFPVMIVCLCVFFRKTPPPKVALPNLKRDRYKKRYERSDYSNVIQLAIHADRLMWERLYYFLVFNSILLLAWVSLFSANSSSPQGGLCAKPILLFSFSFVGLLISLVWGPMAIMRGISFHNYYMAWARRLERVRLPTDGGEGNVKDGIFTVQRDFTGGSKVDFGGHEKEKEYREQQIPRIAQASGARTWAFLIPLVFAALYFGLCVYSVKTFIENVCPYSVMNVLVVV